VTRVVSTLAQRAPGPMVAAVLGAALVVGFVGGGVLGSLALLGGAEGEQLDAVLPDTPDAHDLALTVVSASCEREPAVDSRSNQVEYKAEYAINGDPETAWQCRGDGAGETLVLDLGGTFPVVSVGLVPGYTKVDPHDGTEWYPLNRRLTEVRWHFDDHTTADQKIDPDPALREVQVLELDEAVDATLLTLEIVSSVPGSSEAHPNIAVSDIQVVTASGTPG
jgi:hypothetical protein